MDNQENVWKANLQNGLFMACIGMVYTFIVYSLNFMLNPVQPYIFYAIQAAVLFFMLRSFREKYRSGFVTYGQSFGAGMVIFVYFSIIMALFTFILYKFIDPTLIDQQLAHAEQLLVDTGIPQSSIDMAVEMQTALLTPTFISLTSIFSTLLYGTVFSLIISIFIKKEQNPLLEN